MYYVEFYSLKAGVDPETFHETVTRTTAAWADANPEDRIKLAVGRTWRLGLGPHYIVVVEIDSAQRIDEWKEQRLTDPESRRLIEEWLTVADCDAGVYEDLGVEQL